MKKLFLISLLILISCIDTVHAEPTSRFVITNISPIDYYPSQLVTLNITLKNYGTQYARDVTAELSINESKIPIKIIGENKKYVAKTVLAGEDTSVQYLIYVDEAASKGVYTASLIINWKVQGLIETPTPLGLMYTDETSDTLDFGIRIVGFRQLAKLEFTGINITPEFVVPGESFVVEAKIRNVGGELADSIKVKLSPELPFSPAGSTPEAFITSLKQGEAVKTSFAINLDKSAASRLYNMMITLEYFSRNIRFTENSTFGITVKGAPKIFLQDITLEPNKLEPGIEGLMFIKIKNAGTEKAQDVKISVSGADDILTETFNFIGEIARDTSDSTTFGIYINPNIKTGVYGVNIDISYKDKFGNNYSTSKIYELSIFPKSSIIVYVLAAGGLVVLSVLGYLLIFMIRE